MAYRTNQQIQAARKDNVMTPLSVMAHLSYRIDAVSTPEHIETVKLAARTAARTLNAAGFELVYRLNLDTGEMEAYAMPMHVGTAHDQFNNYIYNRTPDEHEDKDE